MTEDKPATAAVEDFVAASGRARGMMDRMTRAEVQQVRVAARRALAESLRTMGKDLPGDVAIAQGAAATEAEWDAREQGSAKAWAAGKTVAINHLRQQLKAQWVRRVALTAAYPGNPAQRYAELAIAEARLDATREMAELLLSPEDFGLLLDTLPMTEHFRR